MVYFVESDRRSSAIIAQNVAALGITSGFEIVERQASESLRQFAARGIHCDFCFLDPPWADHTAYGATLEKLAGLPLLNEGGVVIAEHDGRFDPGDTFSGSSGTLQL